MKALVLVVLLLLVGIAGLGFYQGWFRLSTDSTDHHPSATITVDKDKIHADEQEAKDRLQGVGQTVKDRVGGLTDKVTQ